MHPNDRSRLTFMVRYAARHPGRIVPHARRLARRERTLADIGLQENCRT